MESPTTLRQRLCQVRGITVLLIGKSLAAGRNTKSRESYPFLKVGSRNPDLRDVMRVYTILG